LLGVTLSALALPCFAKTILKSEPLVLAPYEVAFVQDASCPAGEGAQSHWRDKGPAPQEDLCDACRRAGLAWRRLNPEGHSSS
jgi:hypothetical protein